MAEIVGGQVLGIDAATMEGTGKMVMTGKLRRLLSIRLIVRDQVDGTGEKWSRQFIPGIAPPPAQQAIPFGRRVG